MTDKKTFGSYIKAKRTEKNYSQKDLAEMLFVTEGAVSKWERGISYPDITLIADICRALDISEHELITASTDTDTRKMKQEARKFRTIRSTWIRVPTVSYAVTLLTCFICNLAINHTLSWFFVALAALICAYTFVPAVSCFFESRKLLIFCISTYLSICLLLFTCAVYTHGLSWFLTACIGVLMGYVLLFVPVLLKETMYARYKLVISFTLTFALTVLMMLHICLWRPFALGRAILVAAYGFAPAIISAYICTFHLDAFLKAGIYFGPAKAANAGGVATSGLEMSQNSMRLSWTFEEVDEKLHGIMNGIFESATKAAKEYANSEDNLVAGANIAGFLKVADAMKAQGVL